MEVQEEEDKAEERVGPVGVIIRMEMVKMDRTLQEDTMAITVEMVTTQMS